MQLRQIPPSQRSLQPCQSPIRPPDPLAFAPWAYGAPKHTCFTLDISFLTLEPLTRRTHVALSAIGVSERCPFPGKLRWRNSPPPSGEVLPWHRYRLVRLFELSGPTCILANCKGTLRLLASPLSSKVRMYLLVRDAASGRQPFPKRKAHYRQYALPRSVLSSEQGWGG